MALLLLASAFVAQHIVRADSSSQAKAPGLAGATAGQEPELHRALGLLQYVLGDYAVAVDAEGNILNEEEFLEQNQILDEVGNILAPTNPVDTPAKRARGAALRQDLEDLQDAVAERRPPAEVSTAVRRLRDDLVATYALRLAPSQPPNLPRGAELFQQGCAACHGSDGRARTALALTLSPPPLDFGTPRLSETLSPYQVFNVMTFGVPGTAMPSFESLTEDERWDLAFHVMSLRHSNQPSAAPSRPPRASSPSASLPSLSELASFTDAELGAWFVARGTSLEAKEAAVASARRAVSP